MRQHPTVDNLSVQDCEIRPAKLGESLADHLWIAAAVDLEGGDQGLASGSRSRVAGKNKPAETSRLAHIGQQCSKGGVHIPRYEYCR